METILILFKETCEDWGFEIMEKDPIIPIHQFLQQWVDKNTDRIILEAFTLASRHEIYTQGFHPSSPINTIKTTEYSRDFKHENSKETVIFGSIE